MTHGYAPPLSLPGDGLDPLDIPPSFEPSTGPNQVARHLLNFGQRVQISPHACIYGDPFNIRIGNDVRIDDFCVIVANGPLTIGNHVHFAPHCVIQAGGGIEIADFCAFSSGTKLITNSDDYSGAVMCGPTLPPHVRRSIKRPIKIGKHVILGVNTTVLPGVTIGEGCATGAHTLVTKSLESWGIYVDTPARRLKEREKGCLALEAKL